MRAGPSTLEVPPLVLAINVLTPASVRACAAARGPPSLVATPLPTDRRMAVGTSMQLLAPAYAP